MPTFGQGYTQRSYTWTDWKAVRNLKGFQWQHEEDDSTYTIWGYDGPELHLCTIWKGAVPDGIQATYSQEDNDTDKADWVENFLPTSNWPLEKKEKDGRSVIRVSTAVPGRRFRLRAFYFKSSDPSSLVNKAALDDADLGDITMKCYDADDVELDEDYSTAVKTVITFQEPHDIEVIGGQMMIDPTLINGTTDEWWISVVGAPDVPAIYGGQVGYITKTNLEMSPGTGITMNGRASAELKNDPVYNSNRIRFTLEHPVGAVKRFQVFLETFR